MGDINIPRIVSVDDHVVEPPELWTSRVSSKFGDRIPHVIRDRAKPGYHDGHIKFERGAPDGEWCDWWIYDGKEFPFSRVFASVGFAEGEVDNVPTTFEEVHPGSWIQKHRLEDMDIDHVEASMCYPNSFPRFCGQGFLEGNDKELALECVKAYNDWILDEWCGGDGKGRLLPLTMVPLWDVDLAVEEVRRCAEKGTLAITFSENPCALGLPSIHSGEWDPLFRACAEADIMLCMHIGSSSRMPVTSPDAPIIVTSSMHFSVTVGSMLDFVYSGTLDRIPELKIFYAESQAGWMPHVLAQTDWFYHRRVGTTFGSALPKPPSEYLDGRMFTSIFNDLLALKSRDVIGMDRICFETDFPHSDSPWPKSKEIFTDLCVQADLNQQEVDALARGNAIKAFGLARVGLEP